MRFAAILLLLFCSASAAAWDSSRLKIPLVVDGTAVPYPVSPIFVLPGQSFVVTLAGGKPATLHFRGQQHPAHGQALRAPAQPGLQTLKISERETGEVARVQVFTLVPAERVDAARRLNGYTIGRYPAQPLRGNPIYLPPKGFVEVTAENAGRRLTPNFRLGQFVSKQAEGYPKYVVLRRGLLLKLENILTQLNRQGMATEGLVIMSGYRTPYYNRAIGNVQYSRHVWGGAADIYIDQKPRDGRMDDLDGNGRIDRADAGWLADFISRLSNQGAFGPRIGGLGIYGPNAARGPFVHVDVRGNRARW